MAPVGVASPTDPGDSPSSSLPREPAGGLTVTRRAFAILLIAALGPVLAGCQFFLQPDGPAATRNVVPTAQPLVLRGSLEVALLRLHLRTPSSQWVYVHRITAPWSEASVNWNNFGAAYDPAPVDSFRADAAGWVEIDLTAPVRAWAGGEQSFHGLLLRQTALATPRCAVDSREDGASPPRLLLWVRSAEGLEADSLLATADGFLWRAQPNTNYGDRNPLYAGFAQPQQSVEMQTLLAFQLPALPLTATLGDRVWLDADANGLQDAGETGLAGLTVELQDAERRIVQSTLTDSLGLYGFSELEPGDYVLRVLAPEGYTPTLAGQGGDPALDSDLDPASGFTPSFSLIAGQADLTRDLGLRYAPVTHWPPRGPAFWARHAGLGHGHGEDLVTPLLPLWLGTAGGAKSLEVSDAATAVAVLRQQLRDRCEESSPNPLTALRAQLLAAKLNLVKGAEGDIAAIVAAADGGLAHWAPPDWSSLSRAEKRQVRAWTEALRRFNTPDRRGWY